MIGFVGGFNDSEKYLCLKKMMYILYMIPFWRCLFGNEFQPSPSFYRHICVCGKPFGKAQADSTSDGDNGGANGLAEWFFSSRDGSKIVLFFIFMLTRPVSIKIDIA